MGFLDRLLGRETPEQRNQQQDYPQQYQRGYSQQGYARANGPQDSTTGATAQDRAAIARYRYLLRTAPPEQIEEAHAQAFSQLTPQQRQQVLQEMTQTLPASERPQSDDPRQMARAATRAEMQQPGYLQRTFGGRGYAGGMGGGGMMGPRTFNLDGSETSGEMMGGRGKFVRTAKWSNDGKTLELISKSTFQREDQEITTTSSDKLELSADGKVLTVARHSESPQGPRDSTWVFNK